MSTSDSQLNSTHLLRFIFDRLKTFIAIGVGAAVLSSAVALMMEEQFKSTVIMFATPQHSIGEQFYEEIKRNDLLEYGETEDAERLLQILNSDRIRTRIIQKYDLWLHYDIDYEHDVVEFYGTPDGKGSSEIVIKIVNNSDYIIKEFRVCVL